MSTSASSQSLSSRYQFKTLLGEGGAGQVYTAWDKHLRRTVAIKQIKVEQLEGNDVRDTWQEAMCLATLKHSNIVTIYDLGIDGDVPYIVMEYIQGETLERMVASAPLETSTFIDIARQCLEGLCSAHHAGLIHRDLKPANIMLTRLPTGSYQVKILDFGIASFAHVGHQEGLSTEESVSGSIHWIAPEQIEGSPANERSDLYSMGCVFYFALTGLPPFSAKTREGILEAHLIHSVRHISEIRGDLPPSMADWIMGLLARSPSERPAKGTQALEEFEIITGRRQVSTRRINFQATALKPSNQPIGDETGSFQFDEMGLPSLALHQTEPLPEVSKANPPPPPAKPKARGLAVVVGAAVVLLVGVFWLVGGWNSGNEQPVRPTNTGKPILRIHGSNTVGSKLAPALVEGFLRKKGASAMSVEQEGTPLEKRVIFELPNNKAPGSVEIQSHGSKTGFVSLANATCDLAMSSNEVKEDVRAGLINKGVGDLRTPACEHVIGLDGLAVIVHSGNTVSRLNKDQIAEIFSGSVRDWSELGREKSGPIHLYARDANSGTFDSFHSMVMGNKSLSENAKRIEDSTELSEMVSNDPDGIGFVGLPYIKNCKALAVGDGECAPLKPTAFTVATEDYVLSRRLYFYSNPMPAAWARELVEFCLGNEGQEIVSKSGFIKQSIEPHSIKVPPGAPQTYVNLAKGAERLNLSLRLNSDESQLDTKASRDLDRLVGALTRPELEKSRIFLVGFSDASGDESVDLERSRKFVELVSSELEVRGVRSQGGEGVGSVLPIASNSTPVGRAKNRRVEVWIKPIGT
ncbi:MAG: protein kinase [Verrucomicrobia bacterium]|nr:protein kinase [Verrucomicrobiota bacterium]